MSLTDEICADDVKNLSLWRLIFESARKKRVGAERWRRRTIEAVERLAKQSRNAHRSQINVYSPYHGDVEIFAKQEP